MLMRFDVTTDGMAFELTVTEDVTAVLVLLDEGTVGDIGFV